MTDGILCGISGWFTPHGVRHHKDIRSVTEIVPKDWTALLAHADEIGFSYGRSGAAGPSDRIFHFAITSGERCCELAINDPFETPNLAHLIRLIKRALNDRKVLTSETLSDQAFAALLAARAAGPEYKRSVCTQA